jgi:hypothetical protein
MPKRSLTSSHCRKGTPVSFWSHFLMHLAATTGGLAVGSLTFRCSSDAVLRLIAGLVAIAGHDERSRADRALEVLRVVRRDGRAAKPRRHLTADEPLSLPLVIYVCVAQVPNRIRYVRRYRTDRDSPSQYRTGRFCVAPAVISSCLPEKSLSYRGRMTHGQPAGRAAAARHSAGLGASCRREQCECAYQRLVSGLACGAATWRSPSISRR